MRSSWGGFQGKNLAKVWNLKTNISTCMFESWGPFKKYSCHIKHSNVQIVKYIIHLYYKHKSNQNCCHLPQDNFCDKCHREQPAVSFTSTNCERFLKWLPRLYHTRWGTRYRSELDGSLDLNGSCFHGDMMVPKDKHSIMSHHTDTVKVEIIAGI